MSKSSLKVDTKRWEQIKRNLTKFDVKTLDVGFFKNSRYGPENDDLPVAAVAYMNDYGLGGAPPRPFMTVDFETYIRRYFKRNARKFYIDLLNKKAFQYKPELEGIGEKYKNALRTIIFDYPGENSDWWAAIKGFNDPLFYTGEMVESVDFRINIRGQSSDA